MLNAKKTLPKVHFLELSPLKTKHTNIDKPIMVDVRPDNIIN